MARLVVDGQGGHKRLSIGNYFSQAAPFNLRISRLLQYNNIHLIKLGLPEAGTSHVLFPPLNLDHLGKQLQAPGPPQVSSECFGGVD